MNLLETLWEAFTLTQEFEKYEIETTEIKETVAPPNSPRLAKMEAQKNNVIAVVRDWPNIPFGD